jgi:hypothetical protein
MNKLLEITDHLSDFSELTARHMRAVPETRSLEAQAAGVMQAGFPEPLLGEFITAVHRWGGSSRQLPRVLRSAQPGHFKRAVRALEEFPPDIESAILAVTAMDGLGISFASKHLRLLRPDLCPVLDSRVRAYFKYRKDAAGYCRLQKDAINAAHALERAGVFNPMQRPDGRWYAADIDMAVYAFIKGDDWA